MNKRFIATVALVCCFIFCFAAGTGLSGVWTGTLKTPDGGEFPLKYTFKADGDKLTGKGETGQGEIPIDGGSVTGSEFSFTVTYNGTEVKNTGKYYADADSVSLNVDYAGNKMHATMLRATN
jgi:hypothetical protein